jgi:heavy metal sensor kinase
MARRPLSVRSRLTLWYTGVLLVIMLAISALAYAGLRRGLMHDADASLLAVARIVAERGEPALTSEQIVREFFGPDFYDKFFRLLDPRGNGAAPAWGRDRGALQLSPTARANAARGVNTFETVDAPDRRAVRLLTMPVVRRSVVVQLVQVGMDLERTHRVLTSFVHTLLLLVPLGVGLAAAGGSVIARRALLRPVDEMSRAARRITAEDLGRRIELTGAADELDRLAETLNGMLGRLDAAFTHLRRFAADAAHELRTPLTGLQGGLEVALRMDRSDADYRAVLASSLQDVEALIRLSEDLLLFSRATAGLEGPRGPVDLEALVLDVAETGVRLGTPRRVSVRLGPLQAATVVGDAGALRRAVLNLVQNAVYYSDAGDTVEIRLGRADAFAEVSVHDEGPGIAPEDTARIFEPFVRLDAGRARSESGSGLGLAIARSIVAAHGGMITVASAPGAGARFTVRLPIA